MEFVKTLDRFGVVVGVPCMDAAGVEPVTPSAAVAYLQQVSSLVRRHHALLTRLDTILGDGDHGDNVAAGFGAVDALLAREHYASLSDLLLSVGRTLVASVGGASGPLYGSAFIAAGLAAGDVRVVSTAELGRLLDVGASAIARRGHCAVNDKTLYDTLRPAADAYMSAAANGSDSISAVRAAIAAGRRGMLSTRALVARRGLAMRLGSSSVGHIDPGAVSAFLLLVALLPEGTGLMGPRNVSPRSRIAGSPGRSE